MIIRYQCSKTGSTIPVRYIEGTLSAPLTPNTSVPKYCLLPAADTHAKKRRKTVGVSVRLFRYQFLRHSHRACFTIRQRTGTKQASDT